MAKRSKAAEKLNSNFEALQSELAAEGGQLITNEEVLRQAISFDSFHKAEILSDAEFRLLKQYNKESPEVQKQLLDEKGATYASLFVKLVSKVATLEVIQYVLCLIDEIIQDDARVPLFYPEEDEESVLFKPFFDLLRRFNSDTFVKMKACKILATLLVQSPRNVEEEAKNLLQWSSERLKTQKDPRELQITMSALQVVLRKDQYRVLFADEDGLSLLLSVARDNMDRQQLLYQTLFCLWSLSFNSTIAEQFSDVKGLVADIVDVIRKKTKLKLRRISLAILQNLLGKGQNNERMIEAGILRVLGYLNQKKWGDEDIESDLEALTETLQKDMITLTSFDIYKQEVVSGNLSWTPVHRSEKFWRENIGRFEDNKFEVLKLLLALIKTSKNPTILSIACFDIGEFVRFHPRGRKIISGLEGKTEIMVLMTHENEEVQKHALLCVQKMMVHNWEYLSKAVAG